MYKSFSGSGAVSIGAHVKYSFKSWKALSQSSFHQNPFHFLKSWKNGWHQSANLEINRLRATNMLVSTWTSFGLLGGLRRFTASIWLRLTLILRLVIKYPRNLSTPTLKAHFSALRRSLYRQSTSNTPLRSSMCCISCLLFTTMLSMYTLTVHPVLSLNILVIIR